MSAKSFLLTALLGMSLLPSSLASPPDVTFLCDKIPEICTNMCWAVRCANPVFSQDLTWENPSDSTKSKRRDSAGCGSGNKCNKGKSGVGSRGSPYNSCDEYPFATTSQSTYPNGKQVSRCVPQSEQNSQGGSLSAAYKRFKKDGYTTHSLNIAFGNPGSAGVNYCNNQACKNDGHEVQNGKLSKRQETPSFHFYLTRSGMTIGSLSEYETFGNFTREVGDNEILSPDFETWLDLVDGIEMRFVTDTILTRLDLSEIAL